MFGWRVLQDPMAEIEDVAGAIAVARQHAGHRRLDLGRTGEQDRRIEIALQRDAIADTRTCRRQIGGPVQTQRITAGFRHHFEMLRSEEHTSELQSLMRISYAVFCLKKKKNHIINSN